MRKVIIFDYDGVIVDSFDIFMDEFIDACNIEGWHQINSKETFLSLFNGNMYENMMNLGMNKKDILKVVNRVKNGLLQQEKKLQLFPMIKETLETLAKDHILLISTSNDTTVVQRFLSFHDLSCFKEIYGSDKHHSKVKKMAMIKTKYPNADYFYVGDTVGDIKEGKQAKINTIAVTWGWHDKELLKKNHPDYIIHKPVELLSIFE